MTERQLLSLVGVIYLAPHCGRIAGPIFGIVAIVVSFFLPGGA